MTRNPITEGDSPYTIDESYFDSEQQNALHDLYLMLVDDGYSDDELEPFIEGIVATTIFTRESLEQSREMA